MGISTLTAGYALHEMMFNDDYKILVIATTQEVAKNLVEKVQLMFEFLPNFLKQGLSVVNNNKLSLTFSNGSSIKAVSSSPDAARSAALSLLICDEFAFIEAADAIWTSAQMTLATGGKCIILSTPNGTGNTFHTLWTQAEEGSKVNDGMERFNPINLPWYLHPDRQQQWRDNQDHLLGPRQAAQECFDGDTRVLTKYGYTPIKDIKVGDLVYTHTGALKPVINVMSHKTTGYVELFTNKNRLKKSKVTNNHPFLTNTGWKNAGDLDSIDRLVELPTLQFEGSNNLNLYDLINPVYFKKVLLDDGTEFYINDRKHKKKYNVKLPLNQDLGYLVGLYLAEGSRSRLRVTYSCNAEKELLPWSSKIQTVVNNLFGELEVKTRITGKNTGQISISSEVYSQFIEHFVDGFNSKTKKLSKNFYNNLNTEFITGLLDGYLQGDGCLLTQYKKSATSVSKNLIYDIKCVSELLGISGVSIRKSKSAGTAVIEGRVVNTSDVYEVNYKNTKGKPYSIDLLLNEATETKSYKNKIECPEILVYNLEVYEDHTYITEHGVVHNCDCDFLTSGHTFIDVEILAEYADTYKEPVERRGIGGDLWIWDYPQDGREYVVVLDPARGDGSDNSGLQVFDTVSCEQVAEFRGKIDTRVFARLGVSVATEYNNAWLLIDNKGYGWDSVQEIIDLDYKKLFYSFKNDPYFDKSIHLNKNYDLKNREDTVPGMTITTMLRPVMLAKLDSYMKEHTIILKSKRLGNELRVFVWLNGKPQAQRGHNDDLVICTAMFLYFRDTALKLANYGIGITKSALKNIHKPVYKPQPFGQREWEMNIGRNGTKENLKWLL